MTGEYGICSHCIMDTSDPNITFDEKGICSHCRRYEKTVQGSEYLRKQQPGALDNIIATLRERGKRQSYDCIIGVSGGVDSTYVAYKVKQMGLRPLAVHLDNGWDSELAVSNMEKTLKTLRIDLYTHVLNWDEFRSLQLAFLKCSTPDCEIPTDHAILAVLYQVATRENVKHILIGRNTSTEGGGVAAWSQGHGDWLYINKINDQFGTRPLKTFPHCGPVEFLYYAIIKQIRFVQILDYFDYDKSTAMNIIQKELGWKYYGGKHYESIYTRFYQGHILPSKFGYNKRRLHLSCLIWSKQMTREKALAEMKERDYPDTLRKEDEEFVLKKLGIQQDDFDTIMKMPPKTFWDYPSYKKLFRKSKPLIALYHSLGRS